MQDYYKAVQKDADPIWPAVVMRGTDQVIGEKECLRMFPAWRTTDWSLLIGQKSAYGQGYGTGTARLMLNYAFGYLNFQRISIGMVGFNTSALRFYGKLGFKQEGI